MSLQPALEALKRKNFAAARDLVAAQDSAAFTLQHFLIKGLAEMALEDWDAALPTFAAATGRFPEQALLWLNRGLAEEKLELIDAAIVSQEKCAGLKADVSEAYGNLSNLYRKKKRFVEAEAMARLALEHNAAKGDALNCLGLALLRQGKFVEARAAFGLAREQSPQNAGIVANLANLEAEDFRFEAAWELFTTARAMDDKPVFRHDEALARMLAGDYEKGWRLFEARADMPNKMRLLPDCPHWNGESLKNKKLLIIAEQGFGDVVQFCRYEQFLPEGDLVWAVPQNLTRLLSMNLRGKIFCEKYPLPACDYYVPVLSLPLATGKMTLDLWRGAAPYLKAPSAPSLPQGKHQRKIGIVWAGSATHERDHERSIRLEKFAPLLRILAADFYAPFVGDALNQIGDLPVMRLDHLINDFADTAALLKQMDCLITVDTAVAHVAGALGIPTYMLLPHCPDWRWGVTGENTDWYAPICLLRQEKSGDWDSVIEKLTPLLIT